MYDARKIANLILASFDAEKHSITNIKLNKLLFLVHGLFLARKDSPLIKNHFEAWTYGPVVRVIYDEFKCFSRMPIGRLAAYLDYETGTMQPVSWDDVRPEHSDFVLRVSGHYMSFTAGQLVDLTHERDGPWDQVTSAPLDARGLRDRIANEVIAVHFRQRVGDRRLQ